MTHHLRESTYDEARATGDVKDCVMWASASKIDHEFQCFFIFDARRGGKGNRLFGELVQNEVLMSRHRKIPPIFSFSQREKVGVRAIRAIPILYPPHPVPLP